MLENHAVLLPQALITLFLIVSVFSYFWLTPYTPSILFLFEVGLFLLLACAFLVEVTTGVKDEAAVITATGLLIVSFAIYWCARFLFYIVVGVIFSVCFVPDHSQLWILSFRYSVGSGHLWLAFAAFAIPCVVGCAVAVLIRRALGIAIVREVLFSIVCSYGFLLASFLVVGAISISEPDNETAFDIQFPLAVNTTFVTLFILRLVLVYYSIRYNWFCSRQTSLLLTDGDATERAGN